MRSYLATIHFTENLVAGAIGPDESAIEAAIREMKEETELGLRDPVVVYPGAYVSSAGTSEKITIVAGSVDVTRADVFTAVRMRARTY